MKIAVIGSRNITVSDLGSYLPENVTEIVSGGAREVDSCAQDYANKSGIPLRLFLPDYKRYGRGAPLRRNLEIVEYADMVIAFWDGKSKGTGYVIDSCKTNNKPLKVVYMKEKSRLEEEMKNISDNIINLRKNNNYTKTAFAKLMGVSLKTLNRIENGDVPSFITLRSLAKVQHKFGINVFIKHDWDNI